MKKILSLVVISLAILLLLSFIPSKTIESDVTLTSDDGYLTLVPAAPPKTPPIK